MRLTLHSDLAFRIMIFLAVAGEQGAAIAQIARAYHASENHLSKVVQGLVKAGFVNATRGRGGGLRLRVAPEEISVGAVIRGIEPDFALADCLGAEPERCVLSGFCGLQWIFDEALEAWFRVLDRYTLADVVKRSKDLPRLLGLS